VASEDQGAEGDVTNEIAVDSLPSADETSIGEDTAVGDTPSNSDAAAELEIKDTEIEASNGSVTKPEHVALAVSEVVMAEGQDPSTVEVSVTFIKYLCCLPQYNFTTLKYVPLQ
jgi:hypothetical protein